MHKRFTLQWHITASCEYDCKHCYMKEEESFENEKNKPLSYNECLALIDEFIDFTRTLTERFSVEIEPYINFTGGDPLIRKDFFKILSYVQEKGLAFGILGNPNLINTDIARRLKSYGILKYQISLDGLEETHDYFRTKGSFECSLSALETLKDAGIKTHVMSSVSKENYKDVIPLMNILIERGIDNFAFARVSSVGNAKELNTDFSPKEYRNFLLSVHNAYEKHRQSKKRQSKKRQNEKRLMSLAMKDNLWTLLRYELGLFNPDESEKKVMGGCGIGIHFLVVLADGLVYACRRFPSRVGKVPESKLIDIFLKSNELNYYRQHNLFEKCSSCPLLKYCRGCPAMSYENSREDFFKIDPQCWR